MKKNNNIRELSHEINKHRNCQRVVKRQRSCSLIISDDLEFIFIYGNDIPIWHCHSNKGMTRADLILFLKKITALQNIQNCVLLFDGWFLIGAYTDVAGCDVWADGS